MLVHINFDSKRMPDTSPIDSIDYTSINFPSDRITIADVRRAHPERFDAENGEAFEQTHDEPKFTLNLIIYLERLLARAAYERARGKAGDVLGEHGLDRDECVEELTKFFGTYRVAKGANHTEQLIRDIESQAAAQAASRPR
jgi:hypothetical protein